MTLALVSPRRNSRSRAQTSTFLSPDGSSGQLGLSQEFSARRPHPGFLSQESSARCLQTGLLGQESFSAVLSHEFSAKSTQLGVFSQESLNRSPRPGVFSPECAAKLFGVARWSHSICVLGVMVLEFPGPSSRFSRDATAKDNSHTLTLQLDSFCDALRDQMCCNEPLLL